MPVFNNALPVVERIAAAIATQLATVQITNGYHIDINTVIRPKRLGIDNLFDGAEDKTAILFQGEPELDEVANQQTKNMRVGDREMGLRFWVQPFTVMLFRNISEADTTPADQHLNVLRSDVEACLLQEPTFGNLARGVWVMPSSNHGVTDGQLTGLAVNINVHYGTLEADPYEPYLA